jgi:ribose 5-phosphate isomerase B
MKVFLTADHGGFELKAKLYHSLIEHGFEVEDIGPYEYDAEDDYPVFAKQLAERLLTEGPEENRGIIVCRSATGVSIAVNRHAGIRGAIAWNETVAKHSREHNDSNILCLSGDYVSQEDNLQIAKSWLDEPFSNEPRHKKRIDMIDEVVEAEVAS